MKSNSVFSFSPKTINMIL